jgi:2,3-dihydroxybenzoate decarboxylase
MDAHGVEYMLLSLTSPGAQGESNREKAQKLAADANDWLAGEVANNPARFGGFAAVSMHNAEDAVAEARRAVQKLGMYGIMLNDYQVVDEGGDVEGKKYYDAAEFEPFWKAVEELDVPVYMHPRYPQARDLEKGTRYGERKQILGAAVQFHLDLSMHIYAICSSGVFDRYPGVQLVAGHLGEG